MLSHDAADVNGVRLHYVVDGAGPLLVCLHGFPEFWYAWANQLAEFARDHRVVAPDMRGYNLSSKPAEVEQYRMKYLVADVCGLLEHLGERRCTLVGHDWGGVVAWAFALAHPELLDRLIIINAPHPAVFARELRDNPAQQQASQYMLIFRSPQAEALLLADNCRRLVGMVMGEGLKKGYFDDTDRAAYLEAWSQPGAITAGLNYYRAARLGPLTGEGDGEESSLMADSAGPVVQVRTLVIWGEKDTALLTGNLDGLEPFVPGLSVRRIPEGTHWVVHEQPALVNQYIREFMQA
jgi:epoxide hydrolase 4